MWTLQGLQSDAEFVTIFARSKWRQSRWAPSRIRIVSRNVFQQPLRTAVCCSFYDEEPFCLLFPLALAEACRNFVRRP